MFFKRYDIHFWHEQHLPRYHEGSQVSSVDGQEDHSE